MLTQLDVRTIYVVIGLIPFVMGIGLIAASTTRRFDQWVFLWGSSNLIAGCGILLLTWRDFAPDFLTVFVANTLVLIGYFILSVALSQFCKRTFAWHYHLALLLLAILVHCFLIDASSHFSERVALSSACAAIFSMTISRSAFKMARRENIRTAYVLATLFGASSVMNIIRSLVATFHQLEGTSIFTQNPSHIGFALVSVITIVLWNMCILLTAVEHTNQAWIGRALRDPLTSALNRAGLIAAVKKSIENRRSDSVPARSTALLVIDIDHFKIVNDTLGHALGDQVLTTFADIARSHLRASDLFARQGGDEFVIVLPGTEEKIALEVAGRLQRTFKQAISLLPMNGLCPTLSIGIAIGETLDGSLETLMAQADNALYESKQAGRNKVTSIALNLTKP
ncbi:hypothetical protein A7981_03810 [Methylovorus sp. MM2]|uniref:GGDEF domain-containing protein n=1 Tax=Methylovorus sp. MM2 TaxID=1848038 RepID=UPI0007E2762D|nr:GGDEF domain-containing protein [Methylovorus sp. MM2]OAM52597.1 hypothetical protein A7981_03810 [Methylovorus sp. MM2]